MDAHTKTLEFYHKVFETLLPLTGRIVSGSRGSFAITNLLRAYDTLTSELLEIALLKDTIDDDEEKAAFVESIHAMNMFLLTTYRTFARKFVVKK